MHYKVKAMTAPEEAAENLRVIRNLMERATVYRAISAPTALFAGILALPTAYFSASQLVTSYGFLFVWIGVYLVIDGFNAWLLWKESQRRKTEFISPGLLHAVVSLGPPMFAGAIISLLVIRDSVLAASLSWVVFYGLGLLATHSFSPKSIKLLGVAFCLAGLALATAWKFEWLADSIPNANWVMGGTFGLFHLVYGIAVGTKTGFRGVQAGSEA